MSNISLKNITKQYGKSAPVIENFNMEIEDKEFLVLVGPSGCGKSTLLRMIAGLEEVTQGELFMGAEPASHLSPKDRDIAMVFQNYALYPHMTVYENMAFGLKNRNYPKEKIKERVNAVAERLEIFPLLSRYPTSLSGGQKQRVALGRAMVRKPAVFLLDEPLSNLDAKLRTNMRAEIRLLHQEVDTTFIYVTHDQTEAMTMSDRIAVMRDGKLMQLGTPDEIYHTPQNLFVAAFIGSPTMNFSDARHTGTHLVLEGQEPFPLAFENSVLPEKFTLGIRPEALTLFEETAENTIPVEVFLTESVGSETYVHFMLGKQKWTATVQKNNFQTQKTYYLALDSSQIHFFDEESEQRLEK